MATSSGTVGASVYRVNDVMESIARRCGVTPDKLSPEGMEVITSTLWRLLSQLSNRGVNLWRLYHALYPFYQGQQTYQMARGDIDIMRLVYRTPQRLSADLVSSSAGGNTSALTDGDLTTPFTQSSPNGNVVFDWGSDAKQAVAIAGIMSASATSYNLVFETSDDNLAWTTVFAPGSVAYAAGEWKWYEIEPAGPLKEFFRVRETGGATLSLFQLSLASKWSDIDITRWSLDQWSVNPNKRGTGQPRQYYFERLLTPQFNTWPVAGTMDALNCMCAWVHRHIEDVGTPQNILDIPERWYQPMIDTGAFTCLPELPGADLKRYEMLKDLAINFSLIDAEKEERDKSPFQLNMGTGVYTK